MDAVIVVSEACLPLHEAQKHERHDSVLNAILDVLINGTDKLATHPNLGCLGQLVDIFDSGCLGWVGWGWREDGGISSTDSGETPKKNPKDPRTSRDAFGPLAGLTKGQVASVARFPCFVCLMRL